jgi:hypothetical protein
MKWRDFKDFKYILTKYKKAGAELCQALVKLGYPDRLGDLTKLSKQVWVILTTH